MKSSKLRKIIVAVSYSVITVAWIIFNVNLDVNAWKNAIEAE